MTAAAEADGRPGQGRVRGQDPRIGRQRHLQQQAVAFDLVFEGVVDLSLAPSIRSITPRLSLANGLQPRPLHQDRRSRAGIHAIAKLQHALLTLPSSDLCADVKAAAANGFAADPPGTTASLKRFSGVLVSSPKGFDQRAEERPGLPGHQEPTARRSSACRRSTPAIRASPRSSGPSRGQPRQRPDGRPAARRWVPDRSTAPALEHPGRGHEGVRHALTLAPPPVPATMRARRQLAGALVVIGLVGPAAASADSSNRLDKVLTGRAPP